MTAIVLLEPGPVAFMILDLSTSAGEQTAGERGHQFGTTDAGVWLTRGDGTSTERCNKVTDWSVRKQLVGYQLLLEPVVTAMDFSFDSR